METLTQNNKNKHTPDSFVSQPTGVTLVEPVFVRGGELSWGGDGASHRQAGLYGRRVVQGVATGTGPVVEDHAWGGEEEDHRK